MLRITPLKSAASYYTQSLTRGDYYSEKSEISGTWKGKSADLLGISGEIAKDQFDKLCSGSNPLTGEGLTARKNTDRREAYDFTFSVPKSISLLSAVSDRPVQNLIQDQIQDSMRETMQLIEQNIQTRVRLNKTNSNRVTGNIVYGYFFHKNSRPVSGYPDPHIHIHTVVMNLTFDFVEQKWKAIEMRDKLENREYYQAIFNSKLASKFQELGLDIRKTKDNFEIVGVSDQTIKQFSRRTKQIENQARELGIENDKQKSNIGARTRESKSNNFTQNDLKEIYQELLYGSNLNNLNNLQDKIKDKLPKYVIIDPDYFKIKFQDFTEENHQKYSKLAKLQYLEQLQNPNHQTVVFTGGGSGSGKTERIVDKLIANNFEGIIKDGTLSKLDNDVGQINQALEAGKKVEIIGVLADIENAWKFVQKRALETGRSIPAHKALDLHNKFRENFPRLIEHYKDNPNVVFRLVDNRIYSSNPKIYIKRNDIIDIFESLKHDKDIQLSNLITYDQGQLKQSKTRLQQGTPEFINSADKERMDSNGIGDKGRNVGQKIDGTIQHANRRIWSGEDIRRNHEGSTNNDTNGERRYNSLDPSKITLETKKWLDYTIQNHFERHSLASEQRLIAEVLKNGIGQTNLEQVTSLINHQIQNGELVLEQKDKDIIESRVNISPTITTKTALEEEQNIVKIINSQIRVFRAVNPNFAQEIEKNTFLNDNQKNVISQIMTNSDGVTLLEGKAGTGKTTTLKSIEVGLLESGYTLTILAPTTKAVEVLQEEGFTNAQTLQKYLLSKDNDQSQSNSQNNPSQKSFLIVDESSLVSTGQLNQLLIKTQNSDQRTLLVGDSNQHKSVERGNILKVLKEHSKIHTYSLNQIQRQNSKESKKAVEDLSVGNIEEGLSKFQKLGFIKEIKDDQRRLEEVSKRYINNIPKGLRTIDGEPKQYPKLTPQIQTLVICPTHSDGQLIHDTIRQSLKSQNIIGNDDYSVQAVRSAGFTNSQKTEITNYQEGQILQFAGNKDQFKKGEKWEVIEYQGKTNPNQILFQNNLQIKESKTGKISDIPTNIPSYFDVLQKQILKVSQNDLIQLQRQTNVKDKQGIEHKTTNGAIYQIKSIDQKTGNLTLTNNWVIPSDFGNLKSAYYSTSHASQGQTAKHSIFYTSESSLHLINQEMVYVSNSRFKETNMILTPDINSFKNHAQKGEMKQVAMSVKEPKIQIKVKSDIPKPKSKGIKM